MGNYESNSVYGRKVDTDLILLCVVILTFIEVIIDFAEGYLNSYLKRKQATMVNGVFVMLVFLRHLRNT